MVGVKIASIYLLSFAIASPLILIGILQPDLILVPIENATRNSPSTAASRDRYRCAVANNHFLVYGSLVAFFIPLAIMLVVVTLSVRLLANSNGRRSRWFAVPASQSGSLASTATTTTLASAESIPIVDNRRPSGLATGLRPSTPDKVDEWSRSTLSDTRRSEAMVLTSWARVVNEDDDQHIDQRSDGAATRFSTEQSCEPDSIAASLCPHDSLTSSVELLGRHGGPTEQRYDDASVIAGDCAETLPHTAGSTRSDGTARRSGLQVGDDRCVRANRRKTYPLPDAGEMACKGFRSNSYATFCTEFLQLDLPSKLSPPTLLASSATSTGIKVDLGAHANRRKSTGDQVRVCAAMTEHDCSTNTRSAKCVPCGGKNGKEGLTESPIVGRGAEHEPLLAIKRGELRTEINECRTDIGSNPNDQLQILDLLPTDVASDVDGNQIMMSRVRTSSRNLDDDCPGSPTESNRRLNDRREFSQLADDATLSTPMTPSPTDMQVPHRQSPTSNSIASSCLRLPRLGLKQRGTVSRRLNGSVARCHDDDDADHNNGAVMPPLDMNLVVGSSATSHLRTLIRRHRNSIRAAAAASTSNDGARRLGAVKNNRTRSKVDASSGGCPCTSPSDRSERKAARVLGTVFAVFVVCWTPFFAVNMAIGIGFGGTSGSKVDEASTMVASSLASPTSTTAVAGHQEFRAVDQDGACGDRLLAVCQWLGYVSSTLNPIIYTAFNRMFRRTFVDLIARCRCTAAAYRAKEQRSATATAVGCARRLISATARLDVQQDISPTVLMSHEAE